MLKYSDTFSGRAPSSRDAEVNCWLYWCLIPTLLLPGALRRGRHRVAFKCKHFDRVIKSCAEHPSLSAADKGVKCRGVLCGVGMKQPASRHPAALEGTADTQVCASTKTKSNHKASAASLGLPSKPWLPSTDRIWMYAAGQGISFFALPFWSISCGLPRLLEYPNMWKNKQAILTGNA